MPKKLEQLQSFSIKNIDAVSNCVGYGIVVDGVVTKKRGHSNVIFSLTEKEINCMIDGLTKLIRRCKYEK